MDYEFQFKYGKYSYYTRTTNLTKYYLKTLNNERVFQVITEEYFNKQQLKQLKKERELPDIYNFVVEGYSYSRGSGRNSTETIFYRRKLDKHEGKEISRKQFVEAYEKHIFITQLKQLQNKKEVK